MEISFLFFYCYCHFIEKLYFILLTKKNNNSILKTLNVSTTTQTLTDRIILIQQKKRKKNNFALITTTTKKEEEKNPKMLIKNKIDFKLCNRKRKREQIKLLSSSKFPSLQQQQKLHFNFQISNFKFFYQINFKF